MKSKTRLIILLLFSLSFSNVFAGDIVPVLLRVPRADQHDTLGSNFAELVTLFIYNEIIEGRVKLWDSPSKEIQITGVTLQELERSSDTRFTGQEIFYIYENWAKTKTGITSNTIGFTFLNKNMRGEDVSYGYVDYNDVKDAFVKNRISTNADGIYNVNYATYLFKKMFNYNIVQFAGKTITTGGESQSIKADFVGNLEFNPSISLPPVPDKDITYVIEKSKNTDDPKAIIANDLIKHVETYFMFNEEVFYNLGGDKFSNYLQKDKFKVTRLECNEIWKKSVDGIYYMPKTVTIFVNDSALNTITFREFTDFNLDIDSRSVLQLFSDKDYSFVITQINSQKIARKEAYLYYKGLMTFDWKKITEFVKYY